MGDTQTSTFLGLLRYCYVTRSSPAIIRMLPCCDYMLLMMSVCFLSALGELNRIRG